LAVDTFNDTLSAEFAQGVTNGTKGSAKQLGQLASRQSGFVQSCELTTLRTFLKLLQVVRGLVLGAVRVAGKLDWT
jgi:hypothetical protein